MSVLNGNRAHIFRRFCRTAVIRMLPGSSIFISFDVGRSMFDVGRSSFF